MAMPGAPSSFLLLLVRHLLLEAMHLFLVASCYSAPSCPVLPGLEPLLQRCDGLFCSARFRQGTGCRVVPFYVF